MYRKVRAIKATVSYRRGERPERLDIDPQRGDTVTVAEFGVVARQGEVTIVIPWALLIGPYEASWVDVYERLDPATEEYAPCPPEEIPAAMAACRDQLEGA